MKLFSTARENCLVCGIFFFPASQELSEVYKITDEQIGFCFSKYFLELKWLKRPFLNDFWKLIL